MHLQNETTFEEIENVEKNETGVLELKNLVTELKNSLKGINNRPDQGEKSSNLKKSQHTRIWMNLEDICMLSETSQSQIDKYCLIPPL